jgi:hypothetical protein
MLAPEQVLVTKAMRTLLRDQRGSGLCATCLIERVGHNSMWSMRDARRAVEALFASPGQFVMTTVCVGCGEGVTTDHGHYGCTENAPTPKDSLDSLDTRR